MTKHEFIFSHQRKHRLSRHIVFWLLWSLAFNLLFHFPIHVYKGWDVSGPGTKQLHSLGLPLFFIKSLFVNSLLAVIVPQIALTYFVLYWLLPNYYYKKRNYLVTAAVTAFVVIAFYFVSVGFKHSSSIYNKISGQSKELYSYLDPITQRVALIDQLSSLPIILGCALMIKLAKRWWTKQKETEQLLKEKTRSELQLLKAQVHPHFLFNTLNNIYFFTLTNSEMAAAMIKKLSGLLNYILNECDQRFVPLEKEIRMIQDYMALEKIRYAEHMQIAFDIKGDQSGKMIAPLMLIPFVENSFKHGASKMITRPWITVNMEIENNRMRFAIRNSKPSVSEPAVSKGNIGLRNVKKRLELLYPGTHELNILSDADSYTICLNLDLHHMEDNISKTSEQIKSEYTVA